MRNDRYGSLDGIKGFALIGIIWYHLSQRSLPGGFIGVDVFFTVSGFLLALSVLREIDRTGRLRLGNFYLRRLSRLWPAMAFMIACGVDDDALRTVDFWASHEALLLDYEHPLTRIDSRTDEPYNVSGHMLWIGERTRQLDGAHVEFLRHGLDTGGARQHRYVGLHGAQAVDDAAGRTGRVLAAGVVEDVVRHFAGDDEGDAFVVLRRIDHAARAGTLALSSERRNSNRRLQLCRGSFGRKPQ